MHARTWRKKIGLTKGTQQEVSGNDLIKDDLLIASGGFELFLNETLSVLIATRLNDIHRYLELPFSGVIELRSLGLWRNTIIIERCGLQTMGLWGYIACGPTPGNLVAGRRRVGNILGVVARGYVEPRLGVL